MIFPRTMFPYLYELERLDKLGLREESYDFRRDYKEILWKEYNKRLDFFEHRVFELGGSKGIHKIE